MSATSKKPRRESVILAARDPGLTNSDDWPEFSLSNATVTLPATSESASASPTSALTSLLSASEHKPLTLIGQLDPPSKAQAHHWLSPPASRAPLSIQVSNVVSYSYGAYADGSIELWAAGKAGWFRLRPSPRYKPVYEEMLEAVKILFFIVDAYATPRKSGKGKNAVVLPDFTAQELFEKYAIEVMGVVKGAPEAAKRFYKHREFLLSIMIEGKEGLSWGKNPLYMHLCRKFADDAKRIRARKVEVKDVLAKDQEPDKKKPATVPAVQHTRQASLDSTSTTSSLKRKRGRPAKNADVISVDSSEPPNGDGNGVKLASQTKERSKPRNTRNTRSNPAHSTTPEIPESQPTTPAAGYDSDSEVPHARRKSALRLKPDKATKGPPKKGSRLALTAGDDEDDDDEDELQSDAFRDPPARLNGSKRKRDGNTFRSSNPAKDVTARPPKGTNSNNNNRGSRAPNRSKPDSLRTNKIVDEGIEIPTSPSASASSPASDDAVAGAPDPLQENVWTCALDGCTHKIYGYDPASGTGTGNNPEVQRLIREHYTLHAYDDDERVRLVKGMAEPSLPVNYLVERVRGLVRSEGLGKVVGGGIEAVGTRFPEPLRTKV